MKLLHGKVSPFTRKVMVCIIEKGLEAQVEIVPTAVGQGKINEELLRINPTGKIPTLITDSGAPIHDSLVICDYLDSLVAEPRFLPTSPAERSTALALNATADGLVVAGVLAMLERGKAPERHWPEFEAAQWAKVKHCLAAIDAGHRQRGDAFDIGTVSALCALGWLDARAPQYVWRADHPALAAWVDAQGRRDSLSRTTPPKA